MESFMDLSEYKENYPDLTQYLKCMKDPVEMLLSEVSEMFSVHLERKNDLLY